MFNIGERIIYGSEGVFTVTEISGSPVDKSDTRDFYVLKAVFGNESNVIYTPVDNPYVVMRAIITREEAEALTERIPEILPLEVDKEKGRRDVYKAAMQRATSEDYVRLIKTVRERRELFAKLKKKLSDADTDYEKKAKFCLYGEMAVSLSIRPEEVEGYIASRLSAASGEN